MLISREVGRAIAQSSQPLRQNIQKSRVNNSIRFFMGSKDGAGGEGVRKL